MNGFVMGRKGTNIFWQPSSMNMGATPDGKTLVGYYSTANSTGGYGTGAVTHGYVLDDGYFLPFDVPNSKETQAMDINFEHIVTGVYTDLAGKTHGFVVDTNERVVGYWQFTTIDYPGATLTRVFGMNDSGDIVGNYVDASGKTHGFIATLDN